MASDRLPKYASGNYMVGLMNLNNIYSIALAGFTGLLGGLIGSGSRFDNSADIAIRATRFELVNSAGTPVALWRAGDGKAANLVFLSDHGVEILRVGVESDGRPSIRLAGRDRRDRIVISLDGADRPMIGMGDDKWQGRVHLGYLATDYPAGNDPDNWGLLFRAAGSERTVTGVGLLSKEKGRIEGFLTVSGKRVR